MLKFTLECDFNEKLSKCCPMKAITLLYHQRNVYYNYIHINIICALNWVSPCWFRGQCLCFISWINKYIHTFSLQGFNLALQINRSMLSQVEWDGFDPKRTTSCASEGISICTHSPFQYWFFSHAFFFFWTFLHNLTLHHDKPTK